MGVKDVYTAASFAAVTPSDTTKFAQSARGIYVGVGGDVVLLGEGGEVVTFTGALAGTVLPVRCVRVNSTSTTATNMVALF